MAKQTTQRDLSQGICSFCQGTFAKNKMTQHLKSCKARLTGAAKQEGEKQRLFHLLVEGKYRPAYWMHVELPATATLADLDDFLRYMWLECCDHLSEFEIDGVSYSYEPGDGLGMDFGGLSLVGGSAPLAADEDEEDEEDEGEGPGMDEIAVEMSRQLSLEFQTDLKDVPVEQIEKKLEEMFLENMPPGMAEGALPMLRPLLSQMASSLQQGTLAEDLEAMEGEEEEDEGGMQSELGEVLEVGKKFSYVYDFGSSSTLSLRVVDEREGVALVEKDEEEEEEEEDLADTGDVIAISIMARNDPPALVCHICGKPATKVPSSSEYASLAEEALCDVHAAKSDYSDGLLPIVNSPRTGICGYTGDEEGEDDWEDEDEDEDEED